jgi:heat shock protein HtpX
VIPEAQPNAFATGRDPNHAVVAVTEGIVQLLTEEELEGVLAHELAHIKNRDLLISTLAATMAGALMLLARFMFFFGPGGRRGGALGYVLLLVVAPVAALLIQLAVSRTREYGADRTGSEFTGDPLKLASALRKLQAGTQAYPMERAEPSSAHLFIVNPLSGGGLASLFSTHPPLEQRIERLRRQAQSG